ncbi:hypothetical protein RI054_26g108830 [Pseudoscourfieldia marina]
MHQLAVGAEDGVLEIITALDGEELESSEQPAVSTTGQLEGDDALNAELERLDPVPPLPPSFSAAHVVGRVDRGVETSVVILLVADASCRVELRDCFLEYRLRDCFLEYKLREAVSSYVIASSSTGYVKPCRAT